MMKYRNIMTIRKLTSLALTGVLLTGSALTLGGCSQKSDDNANVLYVYNWGEYIGEDVVEKFEEETGITVIYDEFETNEVMFPKIDADPSEYDVICPSDYMIAKMIENDLLRPLDWDKMPNATAYTGKTYLEQAESFDPGNVYSVPYTWGTVGILYNTEEVDEEIDSWSVLWDEKYYDEILMQDSVRDIFAVALKYLGYSLNTTDLAELEEARDLLIRQKPLVQAYVVDEVRDKMIAGEAKIGVIYSGEAEYTREENEAMAYVIPKEGTNVWIDAWVITRDTHHYENALKWIDFMCRPDIALENFEYIYYSTPNIGAMELMDEEELENETLFPDLDNYDNLEAFDYLGEEAEAMYFELWKELKSAD